MKHLLTLLTLTLSAALLLPAPAAQAEQVVNIYSSRHYDSDDKLFAQFTEATGIQINLIEGKADELLARIKREGDLSPADLFITVDAGRLHLAVEAGVLQPIASPTLNDRIPENLRHPQGLWFGLSQRVRCIFLSNNVEPTYVTTYAELADPRLDRGLLIRSSSNIYNQSLLASLIANQGTSATQAWANGVVKNMARRPQGGDTDQLRALAAGEGEVAVANHYYYARMIAGNSAADKMAASKIRIVFPDQNGRGAHVNVSGAGVLKTAPNKANAVKFLEFMTTPEAQTLWALENHEYPVIEGLPLTPVLQSFGMFKPDTLNAATLGDNNAEGKRIMDRAGWR
ncbi:MAG: Fe(3+) ABC transporter substrate-binding protein [Planctomycetota bacterium]